jgi:hypothetical protein
MTRGLVVFESMFGNTQVIANSVADGLAPRMQVDLMEVGVAPTALDGDVDLLVVGGPTHAFGMSRPGTRQSAAQQSQRGLVSARTGLREWLGRLPGTSRHVAGGHLVEGTTGPLVDGEPERARRWGAELGAALGAAEQRPRRAARADDDRPE